MTKKKKKIVAVLGALFVALIMFAGPASATGGGHDKPDADNKKVTICHATGSDTNPYNKITVSVASFYNAGHIDHEQGGRKDIYESFTYTTKGGDTVTVTAQGDTSLLAFEDCKAPKEPEKVTVAVQTVDKCETAKDAVTATSSNPSVVNVQVDRKTSTVWEVVAVLDNKVDFKFDLDNTWTVSPDGSRATKTVTLTDEDCDLPETGGAATYNTTLGVAAIAGVVILGGVALATRKRS